jgi:hypothetical protein
MGRNQRAGGCGVMYFMPLDEGATQYDLMPLDGAASNLCVLYWSMEEQVRAGQQSMCLYVCLWIH